MSEHERGAYTPPTDEPLSFDARQPVRGARPFPFTLVISALVLIGLVGAIFVFYRSGVRQAGEAPRTVGEPIGEMKAAAPADAQPQDPAAGLEIYSSEGDTTGPPQFTAPPEQPQPRAATPPVVVTPPPAAAPTTQIAQAPALRPALPAAPPVVQAQTTAPPPKPTPAPAAKPVVVAPPAAKPAAPKPAAATTAAPAKGGAAAVQIGAYSSQALAEKGLSDAASIAGGGHGRSIERIEKDGHTLFRTAVTGFASKADAAAFCGKLKAAGKACFVR